MPKETVNEGSVRPEPRMMGHFQILEKIGQGGMAEVYKGVQPSLNRPVAIKILPEQFSKSEELLTRFEREATVIAQLNHSGIVQVIDRGKEGDTLYIVMEYVEGDGLDDVIRERRLPLAKVVRYSMQICDALEYAHNSGVIHRDLKPSNILIDRQSDRAKIADFGIAALETTGGAVATLTMDNTSLGTMNYMSPEQRMDAHKVTHMADLFSFGVILYEMLTGELPVGHFKLPSFLRPDVPIGFDTVIKKCLATNPVDRFQNAREINEHLERLAGRHGKLSSIRAVTNLSFADRRQRMFIVALGAVVLVVVLSLLVAVRLRRDADEEIIPPPVSQILLPAGTNSGAAMGQDAKKGAANDARLNSDFLRAQGLISQGQQADAVGILQSIVRAASDSKLASEAQYTLAVTCHDMEELEKAKLEYDRFLRSYPDSPRVPDAILGKCRAEWEGAPRVGLLRNMREEGLQKRLIEELQGIVLRHPTSPRVPEALRMVAEVAESGQLADWRTAADALIRVYELGASTEPELLLQAAGLYDKKSDNIPQTVAIYARFLKDFPEHDKVKDVQSRLTDLQTKTAPKEKAK